MSKVTKVYRPSVLMICHVLLALIFGLSFAGEVAAATIRVPRDHASIQQAIDAARSGDKVQVSEGTYNENITLKEGVTLEGGWSKDFSRRDIASYVSTIDGSKKGGFAVRGANNAILDGFTIVNATRIEDADSTVGAGVQCRSTSPTIITAQKISNWLEIYKDTRTKKKWFDIYVMNKGKVPGNHKINAKSGDSLNQLLANIIDYFERADLNDNDWIENQKTVLDENLLFKSHKCFKVISRKFGIKLSGKPRTLAN